MQRRGDVTPSLILFVAGFALVGRATAGGGILGLYPSDGTRLFYFVRESLLSSLADRHIPLWNPFAFFGTPIYADMQFGTFYPLNLPFLSLQSQLAYNLFIGLHVGMAGMFMYLLARTWQLERGPAMVSGLGYMLNGQLVGYAWGGVLSILSAAVWLPLALLVFDRAIRSTMHRITLGLATGAVFGIEVLSGHPQYSYFTAFALLMAALFRFWELYRTRASLRQALAPIWVWTAVLGTGALIAALQLVPTYEAAGLSTRHFGWDLTWPRSPIEGSYNPLRLATWVVPDLFGNPVSLRPAATDWLSVVLREVHSNEFRTYIGIFPLALAAYSFTNWRVSPRVRFLGILAGIGLVMALGSYTPLYGLQYASLPPLRTFRIPARFLALVVFSASLLAGFGAQALADGATASARSWARALTIVAAGSTLCVLLAIASRSRILDLGRHLAAPVFNSRPLGQTLDSGAREELISRAYDLGTRGSGVAAILLAFSAVLFRWAPGDGRPKRAWMIAALGLTAGDLCLQAIPYTSFERVDGLLLQHASIAKVLRQRNSDDRVLILPGATLTGGPDLIHPGDNAFMHYRLLGAGGYDGFELATYRAALDSMTNELRTGSSYLASAFGLRYIVTDLALPSPDFHPLARIGTATLYEKAKALPRFYLAPEAVRVSSPGGALATLKAGRIPAGTALVEGAEMRRQGAPGHEVFSIGVRVSDAGHLILTVSTETPVMLITNDTFYPGWVSYVDGVRTSLFRANGLVRAVPLPSGSHVVEFRFAPKSLRIGAWISFATVLIMVGVAVMIARQERRTRHAHRDAWQGTPRS